MLTRPLAVFLFGICVSLTACVASNAHAAEKIKLTVLLYPWVPDYAHTAKVLETDFETENPTVDLVISEQNWEYYDAGGLDAEYDIYELDGIFLQDFVRAGRLQPLNPAALRGRSDVLKAAAESVSVDGLIYALPHWICALYTFHFSQDPAVGTANTQEALVRALARITNAGVVCSLTGKGINTLAELYADCLLDLGLSPEETIKALGSDQLHPAAKNALPIGCRNGSKRCRP